MENSSNEKAAGGSKVDNLPVAVPDSPNFGIAEVGRVDAIPHVCENQVRLSEAAVHLTEKAHLIRISSQGKPSSGKQIFNMKGSCCKVSKRKSLKPRIKKFLQETHLKSMQGTPVSIFRRAWVMFSIWLSKSTGFQEGVFLPNNIR